MKPIIGVTSSETFNGSKEYCQVHIDNITAISKAGGIPMILPNVEDLSELKRLASQLDGLYLTGGEDVDPQLYNEEPIPELGIINPRRDLFEIKITQIMLEQQKPVLGVCRGCQVLNVALGGSLYQDIYSQIDGKLLKHRQSAPDGHMTHFVHVEKDSLLYRLIGLEQFKVNSRHHQAVSSVASKLKVSAVASDGIVEAIESDASNFILGVQWHPENLVVAEDAISLRIYQGFIHACQKL